MTRIPRGQGSSREAVARSSRTCPFVAVGLLRPDDEGIFLITEGPLVDTWAEVVAPPLPAALACPALDEIGH